MRMGMGMSSGVKEVEHLGWVLYRLPQSGRERDAVLIHHGADGDECWRKLLNCQPQSTVWAQKYEGYRIREVMGPVLPAEGESKS